MRRIKLLILAASALALAEPASAGTPVPTTAEGSHGVSLIGVSAELDKGSVHTSGWVRRNSGSYSVNNAHLHVTLIDADGETLQIAEGRWNGELRAGPRGNRTASFRVRTPAPEGKDVASIRVTVEPGRRHEE